MEYLVPKPGVTKSLVWTYFGFVARGQMAIIYRINKSNIAQL